jgi:hypothetical protein
MEKCPFPEKLTGGAGNKTGKTGEKPKKNSDYNFCSRSQRKEERK